MSQFTITIHDSISRQLIHKRKSKTNLWITYRNFQLTKVLKNKFLRKEFHYVLGTLTKEIINLYLLLKKTYNCVQTHTNENLIVDKNKHKGIPSK